MTLTNVANSYSGGTTVGSGSTLVIDTDGEPGAASGGLILGNAATSGKLVLLNPSAFLAARAVPLGAGGGVIDTEGASTTLSGLITGPGGLTKLGLGTLMLGNAGNSFSGGVAVTGGVLAIDTDGELGAASDDLTLGAATTSRKLALFNLGAFQSVRAATLGVSGGTIDTEGAAPATLGGPVTGPGGVTKLAGTLALAGSGNYTGVTTVTAGTLQAGAANALDVWGRESRDRRPQRLQSDDRQPIGHWRMTLGMPAATTAPRHLALSSPARAASSRSAPAHSL